MPLLNDANAVLLGTNPVDSVYLGDIKVWPSGPELPFADTFRMTFEQFSPMWEPPTSPGMFNLDTSLNSYLLGITLPDALDLDGKPIYDAIASLAWQVEVAGIWDSVSGLSLPGAFGESIFADAGEGQGAFGYQSFWPLSLASFFVPGREYVFGIYDRADAPSIWEGKYLMKYATNSNPEPGIGEVVMTIFESKALQFHRFDDQDLDGNIGVWTTLDVVASSEFRETDCVFEMTNLSSSDVWSSRIVSVDQPSSRRSRISFEDNAPNWDDVEVFCRVRLERS